MNSSRSTDPEFLRDLRAGVRERISRRGLRLLRPSRTQRLRPIWPWLFVVAAVLFLTLGVGTLRDGSGLNLAGRSALWAYTLCLPVLTMAQVLRLRLFFWPDAFAALRFPVSNDWFVRRQWQRGIRIDLWLAGGVFAAAAIAAWLENAGGAGLLAAAVITVGFVVIAVPIATWLAITEWSAWIWRGWWALLVVVGIGRGAIPQLQHWTFDFLNGAGEWIAWILPTGWLARPFLRFLDGDPWAALPAAVPVVLTGLTTWHALPQMPPQIPHHAADPLQLWNVDVQVHPVDALALKHHMLLQD
ncbi:MAG: hypothetical protein J0L84_11435, partial [Verrucomicrobia bacterium]|nr:hypothetical protein [Verrucomicrobiota bacterium]